MQATYIVGAVRTPIGAFCGAYSEVPAHKLASIVIEEILKRTGVTPEEINEVILGCILMAGQGQGPARQASLGAGLPVTTPAWAINQLCGSGLKAVCLASTMIGAGEAECIIAGGMENMTMSPHLAKFVRAGRKMGTVEMVDSMLWDGLTDVFSGEHMGITAETVAADCNVSREDQDKFAAESQRRAGEAMKAGHFDEEIVPVSIPQKKGDPVVVKADEYPKPSTTVDVLAKLRPAFKKDGSVTAGNASGINDGAAAVMVASEAFVEKHGLKPFARIISHATTGLAPSHMGLGPIEASRKALHLGKLSVKDLHLAELNEAFAAQSVAVVRELGVDPETTNMRGGAIALGHPVGASGARILVSLLHQMKHNDMKRGLASLCVGGGMGTAMVVEKV